MALPPRSRLGRGLSALMGGPEAAEQTGVHSDVLLSELHPAPPPDAKRTAGDVVTEVTLDRVSVNPRQPRRTFDDASLSDLADSLRTNGLIQPIVVRPVGDRFELIAGERRFRAAKLAGLAAVPVVVRKVDDYTQAQWALVENIHREDLNPVERAEAYASLMTSLRLTQAELATRLGEQRSSVANYLRLLELSDGVRDLVRTGRLSLGHAKVLAGVTDAAKQLALANLCVGGEWSVRELERRAAAEELSEAKKDKASDVAEPNQATQAHFAELEQQLIQHLGVRVQLRRGRKTGTGQIVLHYGNLDQFDELVRRWGVSLDDR